MEKEVNSLEIRDIDGVDYASRALAAFWRSATKAGGQPMQPGQPEGWELDGKSYVVLHWGGEDIHVYRIQNNRQLKLMKRPPKELTAIYA